MYIDRLVVSVACDTPVSRISWIAVLPEPLVSSQGVQSQSLQVQQKLAITIASTVISPQTSRPNNMFSARLGMNLGLYWCSESSLILASAEVCLFISDCRVLVVSYPYPPPLAGQKRCMPLPGNNFHLLQLLRYETRVTVREVPLHVLCWFRRCST